nr:hypothetical protein [Pseudonocardia nigra]
MFHDVDQLPAVDEAAGVLEQDREATLVGVWPDGRDVRGDQHVPACPQRVVGGQRLGLEHVERRAGEPARLQRRHERVEVDGGAAADVDEERRRRAPAQPGGVEQALGLRGLRDGDHHDVGAGKLLVQRIGGVDLGEPGGQVGPPGVDADHPGAERGQHPAHLGPDGPGPDDQRGGLRHRQHRLRLPVRRPPRAFLVAHVAGEPARHREH